MDFIHIIYTWIFPVLFIIIITAKILTEIYSSYIGLPIIIDCILFLICLSLTIFYLHFPHSGRIKKLFKSVRDFSCGKKID